MKFHQSSRSSKYRNLLFALGFSVLASNCSAQDSADSVSSADPQTQVEHHEPAHRHEAKVDDNSSDSSLQKSAQIQAVQQQVAPPLELASARFVEGTHYKVLEGVPTFESGGKITVQEFFSYGCPHCFQIEPVLKQWQAEGNHQAMSFERVPAFWNPYFKSLAQAYYTLEVLGLEEKLHQKIFDTIHVQRESLRTRPALKNLFVSANVSPEEFDKAFDSFAVHQKLNMADKLFKTYRLDHVPIFVIGGKYVTDVSMAGSKQAVTEVIDYLVRTMKMKKKS